jgi:thiamine biosynthesis lipoprotein ApbE
LNPNEYLTSVKLSNQALTTSASYERSHKVEEKSFSHIISTTNLQNKVLSATVVASSVLEAGVFSTALMIEPKLETGLEMLLILDSLEVLRKCHF